MDDNNGATMSPSPKTTPQNQVMMDFPDAIRKIIEGKRVARVSWQPSVDYGVMKDGMLKVFTTKKGYSTPDFHDWLVNDGDMNGDDWFVLPDLQ